MPTPSLDQLDLETRILLGLARLERDNSLSSTVAEVAGAVGVSESTAREYLHYLAVRGYAVGEMRRAFARNGTRRTRWMFHTTHAGRSRANNLRFLKPRQRLIFATLRKIRLGDYKEIAEAADLNPNGVSQSLPAMHDRGLVRQVYRRGRYWVWKA